MKKNIVIKLILIIVLLAIALLGFSTISQGNTGIVRWNIKVVDEEGNPVPGVELSFSSSMSEYIEDIAEQLSNWDELITNNNGSVNYLVKMRNITDYTTKVQEEISIISIPNGYESDCSKLKYEYNIDQTRYSLQNLSIISGQELLNENLVHDSDISGSSPSIMSSNTISITLKVNKIKSPDFKFSILVNNIEGIGDTIGIIQKKDSKNEDLTVSNLVSYLNNQSLSAGHVSWVKIGDEFVDETSSRIVGTGTKVCLGNYEHTVLVYGDATGDGLINAADINVVIKYFLGENQNIGKTFEVAGDVEQDDNLNAADITRMIKSFLGTLDGDILKTKGSSGEEQEETPTDTTAVYRVEHYLEQADGTYLIDTSLTESKIGEVETTVTAVPKIIEGYIEYTTHPARVSRGVVTKTGNLVLKLYYKLNGSTVAQFEVGDEVKIGNEHFFVIEDCVAGQNTVKLIAKYNLNQEGTHQVNVANRETACKLASVNHWTGLLDNGNGEVDLTDTGAVEGDAIYKAKNYAVSLGGRGRLLTSSEFRYLDNEYHDGLMHKLIRGMGYDAVDDSICFWLGTMTVSSANGNVSYMFWRLGNGTYSKPSMEPNSDWIREDYPGVRPVVEISTSLVSKI